MQDQFLGEGVGGGGIRHGSMTFLVWPGIFTPDVVSSSSPDVILRITPGEKKKYRKDATRKDHTVQPAALMIGY